MPKGALNQRTAKMKHEPLQSSIHLSARKAHIRKSPPASKLPIALPMSLLALIPMPAGLSHARNLVEPMERGKVPLRVHVFEDYETDVEKRWWLRGKTFSEETPESLSSSLPNLRACRSTDTKDFDRKMGDQSKTYRAVIFNPVPGPPMDPARG